MINDSVLTREWHPVAIAGHLQPGEVRPVSLLGEDLVLWRNAEGVHAWKDLCIHRGAQLSLGKVVKECLRCPYHGWTYDSDGACVKIPAHPSQTPPPRAHAVTYACRESGGWIWVSLSEKPGEIPLFPDWGAPGARIFHYGPYAVKAGGPRIIENFLDLAHLSIAHEGILGDESHTEVERYDVNVTADGVTAKNVRIWQPDPDSSGQGQYVQYEYRVLRPLTAYLDKRVGQSRFTMMISATPLTEITSQVWFVTSLAGADHVSDEAIVDWNNRIFMQDIPIVESQKPERLPLDLQAELHLNSDRTSIAYRQWLNQLGLTFGTA
jgi:phenylpropionate dioxygenase-like ring-hydroxylating dioxygenase large terminal subunit